MNVAKKYVIGFFALFGVAHFMLYVHGFFLQPEMFDNHTAMMVCSSPLNDDGSCTEMAPPSAFGDENGGMP